MKTTSLLEYDNNWMVTIKEERVKMDEKKNRCIRALI